MLFYLILSKFKNKKNPKIPILVISVYFHNSSYKS